MKPDVYILKYGSVADLPGSALGKAMDVRSTVGLIVYEKSGRKEGMVVDTGRGYDWQEVTANLKKAGLSPADISHVLLTHQHLDHIENLARFPQAIVVNFGLASYLDRPDYGAGQLYKTGTIEIPEVSYLKVESAHTRKDSVYVIDSENEGRVVFVGDLLFGLPPQLPQELETAIDKSASVDPVARRNFVKTLPQILPDASKFYLGHHPEPVSQAQLRKYLSVI